MICDYHRIKGFLGSCHVEMLETVEPYPCMFCDLSIDLDDEGSLKSEEDSLWRRHLRVAHGMVT